ncbi:MAG: hypothetical protein Q8L15_20620 [Methylobacter sp.]|nr:hypothetical protein [Methylobacter sp.]
MKRSGIRGFEATICCHHIHELYRQQVAVLILHPNRVKTDLGEYNVPRPVEKDAELNESFDLENSGSSLNFKGQ